MDFVTFYVWFEVVWGSSKLECEYQPAKMADEPSQVHVMHEWWRARKKNERTKFMLIWLGWPCVLCAICFFYVATEQPQSFSNEIARYTFYCFRLSNCVCVCVCVGAVSINANAFSQHKILCWDEYLLEIQNHHKSRHIFGTMYV